MTNYSPRIVTDEDLAKQAQEELRKQAELVEKQEQEREQQRLLENKQRTQQAEAIAKQASTFDFSTFKGWHVNGVKYSQEGTLLENYAEKPQLDPSNPVHEKAKELMSKRFRGFYPLVIDLETTGTDQYKNSILQIAALALTFNEQGDLVPYAELNINVHPETGQNVSANSLLITGINPLDPKRKAVHIKEALKALCTFARGAMRSHGCKRTIMTAHNANFDAQFVHQAIERCKIKRSPFHPFTCFDTCVLGAVFVGDTRLAKILEKINVDYDHNLAHDALYDTYLASSVFCYCVNQAKEMALPFLATDDEEIDTGYPE